MNIKHLHFLSATLLLSHLVTAHAYTYIGEWSGNNIVIRAASGSFPPGNPYRTALGTVVSHIYNNPSEAWITQNYNDTSVGFNNDQSEIWASADSSYSPAVTFTWKSWWTGKLVEADVVFYAYGNYTP